ncbi:hypothetical protein K458DRAFT_287530 [Lentithecium fluviatile CBS 122367]|uniref:Uncharacterized protein n=1 Tax=Lentithecium fluviatile CBS 122367 TaxID=1168545 RepID=A0A6G1JKC4_9PLEO|nr:hypothetical protein K458DRAFT_287530 [Lentithecium fluviatile CBS 122367]
MSSSEAGEGDTTLALATLVPYSSDGPTLPVIGAVSTGEGGARKQKMNNGAPIDATFAPPSKHAPKMDLEPLYRPWALLPPELLRTIESRTGGAQWWEENCIPVVFTKNQNVTSGINRLKVYLGYERTTNSTVERPDRLGREELAIAVSAQGEATTKMVGIVEMARRVVKPSKENDGGEGRVAKTWYIYTSLASRAVEKQAANGGTKGKDSGATEDTNASANDAGDFEMRDPGDGTETGAFRSKRAPVLTAWMSKRSIPEFKRAFGEQTLEVMMPPEDA